MCFSDNYTRTHQSRIHIIKYARFSGVVRALSLCGSPRWHSSLFWIFHFRYFIYTRLRVGVMFRKMPIYIYIPHYFILWLPCMCVFAIIYRFPNNSLAHSHASYLFVNVYVCRAHIANFLPFPVLDVEKLFGKVFVWLMWCYFMYIYISVIMYWCACTLIIQWKTHLHNCLEVARCVYVFKA